MPAQTLAPSSPNSTRAVPATLVVLFAALFLTLTANRPFLLAALHGRDFLNAGTWLWASAMLLTVWALNVFIVSLLCMGRSFKWMLSLLLVVSALAAHYMQAYHIVLDAAMVRSTVHTHPAEALELLSWTLLVDMVLFAAAPIALLWRLPVSRPRWTRAVLHQAGLMTGSLLLLAALVWAVFQPLSALMRNDRTLRYLVTPANVLWSLGSVLASDTRDATHAREPLDLKPTAGASHREAKPRVLLLVVGETARSANWGLSGYARDTTPTLAQREVLNFAPVTSCGTDTETSLPCMFAPVGRRDYSESRIRGSQSLLHVLAQAGISVQWRDNQSGCKGVCEGLPFEWVTDSMAPGLCQAGRCWDEGLLRGLDSKLNTAQGTQVIVLHMLGNHGPSYFRRYPPTFAHFKPACENDDLGRCTPEQIVNAYDNALRYTDHVLATAIDLLRVHANTVDSALLYVSDHGESLGEHNLYLHGMPYALAPSEQTQVPMVWWLSPRFAERIQLDTACLAQQAKRPAKHDHLFHSLLGLLDVNSKVYQADLDITAPCRGSPTDVARLR
jgi:lipid A ethanolaminephosphotransferase